jgi:hypothetical protein
VQLEASSKGVNGVARQQEQQEASCIDLQQQQQAPPGSQQDADRPGVWTKFVAETLLPTKQGKFRLRGYRHTVSVCCLRSTCSRPYLCEQRSRSQPL